MQVSTFHIIAQYCILIASCSWESTIISSLDFF